MGIAALFGHRSILSKAAINAPLGHLAAKSAFRQYWMPSELRECEVDEVRINCPQQNCGPWSNSGRSSVRVRGMFGFIVSVILTVGAAALAIVIALANKHEDDNPKDHFANASMWTW